MNYFLLNIVGYVVVVVALWPLPLPSYFLGLLGLFILQATSKIK